MSLCHTRLLSLVRSLVIYTALAKTRVEHNNSVCYFSAFEVTTVWRYRNSTVIIEESTLQRTLDAGGFSSTQTQMTNTIHD